MIELEDILAATGGQLLGLPSVKTFVDFAFDSRRLTESSGAPPTHGPLFVAVKTETGDGHEYAVEAVRRGATGILCERIPDGIPDGIATVVVQDTRQALLDWAQFALRKYDTQVIAVTGSSGKTVTKEAIAAVLSLLPIR
jgi:UDP-N-acetylmuramyl pentapeptide synthase